MLSPNEFKDETRGTPFRPRFKSRIVSALVLMGCIMGLVPAKSFSQPLANGRSKFLGNAITYGSSIPSNFTKYWNQVTPGNNGKWGSVETSPGVYNWSGLDAIYNFALANGMPFKEHCLIWGAQQPGFMTDGSLDSAQMYKEVANWIDSCGHRYPLAAFCDVVNEPFRTPPDSGYRNALGGNGSTGWDWVVNAFKLARESFSPSTKLLINEYNILSSPAITNSYIALIDTLKVRGLIDGIGIQGHYFEFKDAAYLGSRYSYPVATLKYNLDKIASATGLPIYISEFDIDEQDDNTQLVNYQTYFPLFYEDPAVKGITLWGYNEYDTWKPYAYLVTDRHAERPALQWLHQYFASYLKSAIVSPVDTTGVSRNPLLMWAHATAATSYRVQVSTDSLFSDLVADSTVADTSVRLSPLAAGSRFFWHVIATNATDTGVYSGTVSFTTGDTVTGVTAPPAVPGNFALDQNYPNPFNPTTAISYRLSAVSSVTLKVYDVLGREVATLVKERQSPGYYNVAFDAAGLPSGVYFYRLQSGDVSVTKKLVLVK
jgi:endo-1,4-beta-xylanase